MIKLGEIYRNNLEYGLVMEVGARRFALIDVTPANRPISTQPRYLHYQPVQTHAELENILKTDKWERVGHIYDALYNRPDDPDRKEWF